MHTDFVRFALAVGVLSVSCALPLSHQKIDPRLLTTSNDVDHSLWVRLFEKANLEAVVAGFTPETTKGSRAATVRSELRGVAHRSQVDLIKYLESKGLKYRSFWIINALYVNDVPSEIMLEIADRPDVEYVRSDNPESLDKPVHIGKRETTVNESWGLHAINLEPVWSAGLYGQGVVVANIDTGVRYTHEALVGNYRGNLGKGKFDHSYNWFDPINNTNVPHDSLGHGTHTMGTIAGADGFGIGVAPQAKWIAARGCDEFNCKPEALAASSEWLLCPTKVDGSDPDCDQAPDVINNSWGGSGGDLWYDEFLAAWNAAGILSVFCAGNVAYCGCVRSPADYDKAIAVGAVDLNHTLAYFSCKGPSEASEGFRELKPDLVAPGVDIRSADYTADNAYVDMSGTSMAAPHAAGVIALGLSGPHKAPVSVSQFRQAMSSTASRRGLKQPDPVQCEGRQWDTYPSYFYGHGNLDACQYIAQSDKNSTLKCK